MFMCYLKSTPLSGPELLLKVGRTTDSQIFDRVMEGDIESVRSIYLSGAVSIHDVDPIFHQNALIYMLMAYNPNSGRSVRLLWEYGADLSQTDIYKMSGNDYAFMKIISKRLPDDMNSMFDIDGILLETELTTLHQSIIGLTPHSVEEEFEEHPELVDTFDAKGRTALFWAILSDNFEAAKTLMIKQMADTTAVASDGGSGFGVCAEFASPKMARLLVSGQESLPDKEKDMRRWGTNAHDHTGRSPWIVAIQDSSDEFFKICMRWKDQWDTKDTVGRSLLHHAVTFGYWHIVEMFMVPEFCIIDPRAKDTFGITAYDVFWWRFPDYIPPPECGAEDPETFRTASDDWGVDSRDGRNNSLNSDSQTSDITDDDIDDDTRDSMFTLVGGLDIYELEGSDEKFCGSEDGLDEVVSADDFRDRTYMYSSEARKDANAIWKLLKYVERTQAERGADMNVKTNIPGAWVDDENEEGEHTDAIDNEQIRSGEGNRMNATTKDEYS
ncbi:uncharacterized protein K452DRAFT_306033 [Aplosporella prunicola CBS 121167]|uniref:Uncharacterized protein n=1 Tax=Aplosporella prunicola CBS 121167 TaxID=1176127 RepID=A0A6A6BQL5_9PEZI|nr:uncharacterized protein K452DRAFT_306033 [Aplosporella prunicola CBS 121167]KAF2145097.1 hypothetical protein K452DRAFT_306033 [Aplosporella prunicola CBS 121167]